MSGRLLYVIGPSGCGKDSVMGYAREHCDPASALFAHRYITRPADAGGENHVQLTEDEFRARLDAGLFALNWESHGFCYGIGREIDLWMAAGLNVVANGSRGYLPEAAKLYPDLIPVLMSVNMDVLEERLSSRGRESAEEIERRLGRARAFCVEHENLVTIDNSGPLDQAGVSLLNLL